MLRHIPNMLTLLRLVLAPAGALALWLSWQWSLSHDVPAGLGQPELVVQGLASFAVIAFVIAALSDWLDGMLARRWSVQSKFGAVFDPIADKLLVDLYLIVYANMLGWPEWIIAPVGAIILRDIVMTMVRIGRPGRAAETMPVSLGGKLKTALSMGVAAFPLIAMPMGWQSLDWVLMVWIAALWLAAAFSLLTAINYFTKAGKRA